MTAPLIKAIETTAYGCRFRSRSEARWATFFTEAGISWEFEPEGFQCASGWYLPDFLIRPQWLSDQAWVEIKPPSDTVPDPRWPEVAVGTRKILLVVRGLHRRGDVCGRDHTVLAYAPDGSEYALDTVWAGPEFSAAWDAASSARFDSPARGPGRKGRSRRT